MAGRREGGRADTVSQFTQCPLFEKQKGAAGSSRASYASQGRGARPSQEQRQRAGGMEGKWGIGCILSHKATG